VLLFLSDEKFSLYVFVVLIVLLAGSFPVAFFVNVWILKLPEYKAEEMRKKVEETAGRFERVKGHYPSIFRNIRFDRENMTGEKLAEFENGMKNYYELMEVEIHVSGLKKQLESAEAKMADLRVKIGDV